MSKVQRKSTYDPTPNLTMAGQGRKKGVPNKTTALLKDAILKAADEAGGKAGLVGYLLTQATLNPGPFMALLGKVLPTVHDGEVTLNYVALMPEVAPTADAWLKQHAPPTH